MKKYSIAIEIAIAVRCRRRSIHENRTPHVPSTDTKTWTCSAASEIVFRFRIAYRPCLKRIARVEAGADSVADPVRRSSPSSPTPRTSHSGRPSSPSIRPATSPDTAIEPAKHAGCDPATPSDDSLIRHRPSAQIKHRYFQVLIPIDSLPSQTTIARQLHRSKLHRFGTHFNKQSINTPYGPHRYPLSIRRSDHGPSHSMSIIGTHTASRGRTSPICLPDPTTTRSPCPDSPAAIARGWQRSNPGFDDHPRTRFFVRAPPRKGTRTHLREKRLFCAHTSPQRTRSL